MKREKKNFFQTGVKKAKRSRHVFQQKWELHWELNSKPFRGDPTLILEEVDMGIL
ncbi:hypothetical protein BY996DRAFT_8400552 [Phakopsora pachyrhizi]|nr:hypothetical protein BY996DRAFT_8400552 [Phakopsora pachyrhizi]